VASENRLVSAMVKPDLEKIAQTNPLLRQLEAKFNAAKYSASAIRADQLPQVYANYQYGRSWDSWPPENSSWSLGANVSFTLFDGDRNGSAERRASSVITQTALRSADGRQTLLLTMDQAWTDLANARDDVQVRQSFLVAAKERANIANAQYAAGLITFDSWSIIEDSLVNAQKNYVNATAAVLQAEARWLQACGGGFDEN
jgi:outer membrane protein TolC